jgi:hypothetical protein
MFRNVWAQQLKAAALLGQFFRKASETRGAKRLLHVRFEKVDQYPDIDGGDDERETQSYRIQVPKRSHHTKGGT